MTMRKLRVCDVVSADGSKGQIVLARCQARLDEDDKIFVIWEQSNSLKAGCFHLTQIFQLRR